MVVLSGGVQSGLQQDEFQAARKRAQINGLIAVDDTVWAATDTLIRIYQLKKKVPDTHHRTAHTTAHTAHD